MCIMVSYIVFQSVFQSVYTGVMTLIYNGSHDAMMDPNSNQYTSLSYNGVHLGLAEASIILSGAMFSGWERILFFNM